LIDVVDPDDPFDAADYARLAKAVVADIHRRDRLPIVVGGTGLYIKALLYGLFPIPSPPQDIRDRLKAEAEENGIKRLYARLMGVDEEAAVRIHPNDAFRIIRALEIQEAAGRPLSALRREQGFSSPRYSAFTIGLRMERTALYDRIDRRVDRMIADGFLEEVRQLLSAGYSPGLKAMQAIGYRHLVDFDAGRTDWSETVRLLKRDTRRYAKRQLTWFRKDPGIHWIGPGDLDGLLSGIRAFLETGEGNGP
jgi:tRNA dimethylallyltransferase